MGIGARLKEAREANNISLDTLQDATKIQKRYLVAIEEENFHVLPGKFYARAFIKEYANAVGLDSVELLEEFKDVVPAPEKESSTQYTRIQRSRKDNSPAKSSAVFSIIPTLIVVLLVIGIIFAAWYFITQKTSTNPGTDPGTDQNDDSFIREPTNKQGDANSDKEGDDGVDDEDDAEEEAPDNSGDVTVEPEFVLIEAGSGNKPESTFDLINTGDEVILTLESNGKSWLDVKNGEGESLFSGFITPEESPLEVDMTKEERIYLNVGNAATVSINVNGAELEYPADPNKYVVQRIWINLKNDTE